MIRSKVSRVRFPPVAPADRAPHGEADTGFDSSPSRDFCAICDHIRELHELPFVECSHPFTPKQSDQLSDSP